MTNQIEAAGDLIDAGMIGDACAQLLDAMERTDGQLPPVNGDAAAELKLLIEILRDELGRG